MLGGQLLRDWKQAIAHPQPQPVLQLSNHYVPVQSGTADNQLAILRTKRDARFRFNFAVYEGPRFSKR